MDRPQQDQGPEVDDDQREQFERQMIVNEKQNVLREIVQQKRELTRLYNQLRRLRGAADDLAQADALKAKIADFENRIRSNSGEDFDELRSIIEEYRDAELWDEIQKIRLKVELPRELNRLLTDINRGTRLLSQKAFQNLGFDVAAVRARVDAIKVLHSEVRACYQSGDFECANERMQEIREGDHPGELQGAMQMLRGIKEMSKMIRDNELKNEVNELVQPVIQAINSGEWRQAREDMQEIERELRDIMQKILASQRQRRGASEDVRARLERMRQKFEQEAGPGQDNVEEDMMPGGPTSGSSSGGGSPMQQPTMPVQPPTPTQ
ncbi:MAG: hypothetical protein UX17_C0055G0002 [Parcubacteria group bacterium GW2011_GWC2_45_7]|nr:MAG: hypothetical protein UX17_C0055G0002 [Parcubacteria group bacterium GW2011_GWC2_45_7]